MDPIGYSDDDEIDEDLSVGSWLSPSQGAPPVGSGGRAAANRTGPPIETFEEGGSEELSLAVLMEKVASIWDWGPGGCCNTTSGGQMQRVSKKQSAVPSERVVPVKEPPLRPISARQYAAFSPHATSAQPSMHQHHYQQQHHHHQQQQHHHHHHQQHYDPYANDSFDLSLGESRAPWPVPPPVIHQKMHKRPQSPSHKVPNVGPLVDLSLQANTPSFSAAPNGREPRRAPRRLGKAGNADAARRMGGVGHNKSDGGFTGAQDGENVGPGFGQGAEEIGPVFKNFKIKAEVGRPLGAGQTRIPGVNAMAIL